MRGSPADGRRREADPVPVVSSAEPARTRPRVRLASARPRRLPPRLLPRAVRRPRESQLRPAPPPAAPADVVQGPLQGGGDHPRPQPRCCRQVPAPQEVPAAQDHLGRRGDRLLLQGEVEERAQGVLRAQQVPHAGREEDAGVHDWLDHDAGQQLVQEQETARQDATAAQVLSL